MSLFVTDQLDLRFAIGQANNKSRLLIAGGLFCSRGNHAEWYQHGIALGALRQSEVAAVSDTICTHFPPNPSMWMYYRLVWKTATVVEGRAWVKSTGAAFVAAFTGAGITALLFGFDLDEKRPEFVVLGILLLLAGLWSLVWSLLKAPHKIFCEQLANYEALNKERNAILASRDSLRKVAAEKVANLDDVKQILFHFHASGKLLLENPNPKEQDKWFEEFGEFLLVAMSEGKRMECAEETKRPISNDANIACRKELSKKSAWALATSQSLTTSDLMSQLKDVELARWKNKT